MKDRTQMKVSGSRSQLVTQPEGLNKKQAASHINVCVATWDKLEAQEIMPKPRQLLGVKRYIRAEIDYALQSAPVEFDEDQLNVGSGMLSAEDM